MKGTLVDVEDAFTDTKVYSLLPLLRNQILQTVPEVHLREEATYSHAKDKHPAQADPWP